MLLTPFARFGAHRESCWFQSTASILGHFVVARAWAVDVVLNPETTVKQSDAAVALIVVSAGTGCHAVPIELGGYFVDDVQLTAIRQPTLPIRFVK
tara:strand:+ start:225889 stop:226176 length:288 start_codon:yes stop_codon:yes gene_type:complete